MLNKILSRTKRTDGRVSDTYKEKYTWQYIDTACKDISEKCVDIDFKHIIGISRGGLIPATLLSKYLNVREVLSVGIRSYEDGDNYASRQSKPLVYQDILYSAPQIFRGEPVLLVDDISDKGNTFKYIVDKIKSAGHVELYTASIFIKDKTTYRPDFYEKKLPDNEWVIFPWEK
tara:strand:+ start:280 stop:801 length:522 start_codon:yes stop_codon:yes gene_type:complete